jgi:hypothetical protein
MKAQAIALTGVRTSKVITAIASSSSTWTFTAANNLAAGDVVVISGCTPTAYNGTWVVATANSTTFTITQPGNPGNGTVFGTPVVDALGGIGQPGFDIRNWILEETGGATDLTLAFYMPVKIGSPIDTTGTKLFTVTVTKATQVKDRWEDGLCFRNGLFLAASGGVASGALFIG